MNDYSLSQVIDLISKDWILSLYPRKQLPTPAPVHPLEAMLLPRLQWDPRPTPHHVQEALLPMDLWVCTLNVKVQESLKLRLLAALLSMLSRFVLPKISRDTNNTDAPVFHTAGRPGDQTDRSHQAQSHGRVFFFHKVVLWRQVSVCTAVQCTLI